MRTSPPLLSPGQHAVLLLLVPALVGALTAWTGVRSTLAALLLWSEPLVLFGLLYLLGWLLWERRLLPALGLCVGSLAGGAILRVPPEAIAPDDTTNDWARQLRGCTKLPDPVRQPIRVLTWTLDDGPISLDEVRRHDVDLAVLVGLDAPEVAESWAKEVRGEAMILPATSTSERMALVVRGAFQYCDGNRDVWDIPLPTGPGERARAVLTFPEIQGAGVVPFVAAGRAGPTAWFGAQSPSAHSARPWAPTDSWWPATSGRPGLSASWLLPCWAWACMKCKCRRPGLRAFQVCMRWIECGRATRGDLSPPGDSMRAPSPAPLSWSTSHRHTPRPAEPMA